MRLGCGLLVLVLAVGTVGFIAVEGWTPVEALYTSMLIVSTLHKLRIAGADRVLSPYVLGGRSMAGMALRPAVMDFLEVLTLSDDLRLWLEEITVEPDADLLDLPLGETNLRGQAHINVLALPGPAGSCCSIQPPM